MTCGRDFSAPRIHMYCVVLLGLGGEGGGERGERGGRRHGVSCAWLTRVCDGCDGKRGGEGVMGGGRTWEWRVMPCRP